MLPEPSSLLAAARNLMTQEQLAADVGVSVRTIRRWEKGQTQIPEMCSERLTRIVRGGTIVSEEDALKAPKDNFRFIDLFAGIGGTRLAFEAAQGKCVYTSEWDRFSNQTYRTNFNDDHEISGDITRIEAGEVPDHEVLVGGFPCQPFSLAGVSKKNSLGRKHGFADETQGTLFFDIARILEEKRPKAFLLENVKNLERHDKGKTFKTIINTLQGELGYHVTSKVVDGSCMVPQHRERVYIVGFRDPNDFFWEDIRWPNSKPTLDSILHTNSEDEESPFTELFRGKIRVNPKYTLSDHLWNYLQAYAKKHREKGNGFGCSVVGPENQSRTLSARYHKDGSEILIRQERKNPRRLTPRECCRLMGFPDSFQIPVSDTQAYRQFGNSVVVPVVSKIASHMAACMRGETVFNQNTTLQMKLPLQHH